MTTVSKLVRNAIQAALADASHGFNATMATVAAANGVTAFAIDFTPNSKQFFQAKVSPFELDDTTPSKYPIILLWTDSAVNQNVQKFAVFSGVVRATIKTCISWRNSKVLPDFESLGDAIGDTYINLFNGPTFNPPPNVVYNGDINISRGPVTMDAEHWRQEIDVRLTFEVNVN